ncbi:bacteriohemerythrin [Patescibacteria group bacterium]|nr:bacteriohemerythrin [Patescibacteria group bacterium]
MIIEWTEENSVGVKELDEHHQNLVKIANKLYDFTRTNVKDRNKLIELLNELVNFSKYHHSIEEKYFKKFNYEHIERHTKEHEKFFVNMNALIKKIEDPKSDFSQTTFEVLDYLEDWYLNHLNDEDKKYTKTFNENGLF